MRKVTAFSMVFHFQLAFFKSILPTASLSPSCSQGLIWFNANLQARRWLIWQSISLSQVTITSFITFSSYFFIIFFFFPQCFVFLLFIHGDFYLLLYIKRGDVCSHLSFSFDTALSYLVLSSIYLQTISRFCRVKSIQVSWKWHEWPGIFPFYFIFYFYFLSFLFWKEIRE